MPQCKARFCKVKRGQGISAFSIPDPEKDRNLCAQWIHNLGIKYLDIRTYKFSKQNIVCERHFEEECFKKDIKPEVMGYTPKYKHLKPDAVPTIFADSKPRKRRELSEKRIEKKQREELISKLLSENDGESDSMADMASESPSTSDQMSRKRKTDAKENKSKKHKNKSEKPVVGIQVSADTRETGISCFLPTDHSYTFPCSNCYARDNPNIVMSDHMYSSKRRNKVTSRKSSQKSSNHKQKETDEAASEHLCLSDNDSDQLSCKTRSSKEYEEDPTYEPPPSCASDCSPDIAEIPRQNQKEPVNEIKYIVFSSCLKQLFGLVRCSTCESPVNTDNICYHTDK